MYIVVDYCNSPIVKKFHGISSAFRNIVYGNIKKITALLCSGFLFCV